MPQGVRVLTNDTITTRGEEAKTPAESQCTLCSADCCSNGHENKVISHGKLGQKSRGGCRVEAVIGLNCSSLGLCEIFGYTVAAMPSPGGAESSF